MSILQRISEDLPVAMKAKDELGKRTLRMVKADLMKKEADLERPLTDDEQMKVLTSAVKSRRDSIAEYEKAGRADLAEAEREEIGVIERYLPKQLSEDQARDAIRALKDELGFTQKKEMGQLIKAAMAKYQGQIEGKTVSRLAGEVLN